MKYILLITKTIWSVGLVLPTCHGGGITLAQACITERPKRIGRTRHK